MTKRELLKDPLNIWYYIQGNIRHFFYKNFKYALRKHIIEQFEWRIIKASKCYNNNGGCLCCGCDTPQLFFADKACSVSKISACKLIPELNGEICYPKMMNRNSWNLFKIENKIGELK